MGLADRLRALRKVSGLSALKLGQVAGISGSHVGLIESGRRKKIGSGIVAKLAEVLGCTTDYLINGTGRPPARADVLAASAKAVARWERSRPSPEAA